MKPLQLFSALFCALVLMFATATSAETYQAGVHYDVLDQPVRTRDPSKIEVVEVFWYGCGACYKFEPMVQQWEKQQADDVKFIHSPAAWNATTETHGKIYYTAKYLKVLDKMHQVVFDAMNVENKRLVDPAEIEALFVAQGVDGKKFQKMFNSFGVKSQIDQAKSRALGYKIEGTPAVVVNGKYRISVRGAGGYAGMLKVMDFLVAKERAGKS